jgi:hypothetical protein
MATTSDDTLRALIRLIPPAQALKNDLERSLHMELYAGAGDTAVRSFQGLQGAVARLVNDPYVDSLTLQVPAHADDKQKVIISRLAAGQLAAYLEGQTGLVNVGGNWGGSTINYRSPRILSDGTNIQRLEPETLDKIVGIAAGAAKIAEEEEAKPA